MLEKALPKRSSVCHSCSKPLGLRDSGKSWLHMKKKGTFLERCDFCADCSEKNNHRGTKTALWHWEKMKDHDEKRLFEESIRVRLEVILEGIFSKSEYSSADDYEYTVCMVLSRAGIIQKRRRGGGGTKLSLSFSWNRQKGKSESAQSENESSWLKICFISIPKNMSRKAYEEMYSLFKNDPQ